MRLVRRSAQWLVLLLAMLLSLELGAWAALLLLGGHASLEQDLRTGEDRPVVLAPDGNELPLGFGAMADEAIHPFVGYVGEAPEARAYTHGFLTSANPIGRRRAGELRVALLGGSVAYRAAAEIAAELERAMRARGVSLRVVLVQLAYPGYKQPQQLEILAYLLSLGAEFDLVVNLDGYNELVLSITENHLAGVFPFFPRRWDQRISRVPDSDRLREIGRITALRDVQRWILRSVDSWVGHLAIVRLGAELALRWIDPSIAEARERLRTMPMQGTFESRGPFQRYRRMDVLVGAVARQWARSSLLLDRLARGTGAEYHHVLQPNQYVSGSKALSEDERRNAYQPGPPADVVQQGYPVLLRAGEGLRGKGVRFHDATAVFAGVEETLYVDACCHVNDEGDRRLAAFIVEQILATTDTPALRAKAGSGAS